MKLNGIISTIKQELLNGKFGQSGRQFLTANELMEKYPVCHIYLWNSKKDPLHFACGVATFGGKGDPLGYQF